MPGITTAKSYAMPYEKIISDSEVGLWPDYCIFIP